MDVIEAELRDYRVIEFKSPNIACKKLPIFILEVLVYYKAILERLEQHFTYTCTKILQKDG